MEGLASLHSCHATCLAFWREPRHKYTWCHRALRGQAQVGDRNPGDHILIGEGLLSLCCAVGWVAEEGRTRSSLKFSSTGSHSSSHPRPIPEFSHALLPSPRLSHQKPQRLVHGHRGYQLLKC